MEKQLSSKLLYDGKIIKVYRDEVEVQNGNIAIREVVCHNGGVGVIGIIDDCILLVEQFRYPNAIYTLEIPAGKLEIGEDPMICGKRELEEETGYTCSKLELITKALPTPGYCNEILYIYHGLELQKVENPLPGDDDEFINVIKVPISDAYAMIQEGKIIDAKTIIAIQHIYIKKEK